MTRDDYLLLRRPFEPERARLIIVAESPPASGLYFYRSNGRLTEPLFAALMRQLNYCPRTKEDGLQEFQRRGWLLVDATYEPVNAPTIDRDKVILRDFSRLVDDLRHLIADKTTPIILIKANVCRLLEPKLKAKGFDVINDGRPVYFPSSGRQKQFQRQFSQILGSTAI